MSYQFEIGEMVFSREDLFNDGFVPGVDPEALLAPKGCRGVVVKTGVLEADENQIIYLVCFENEAKELGPPIGCLPEELTQDEAEVAQG
jgi:nitrogen fixation protein NifZ